MDPLVYARERSLGTLTLILGLLAWVLIIVGTFGLALLYLLMGFIFYVFAQSAVIAWLRGTAVRLSPTQFPDLHARFVACCQTLGIQEVPEAYVLNGSGVLNAFATRFFGRNFVVLLSDVVDAMERDPDGVNFYMGHELGHIRMKHLTGHLWRLPVLWLPLLGAAYSRAREYTCDLHGRACCASPDSASRALVALATGPRRWEAANLTGYAAQAAEIRSFWASFHELIGGYPWLTKRVARSIDPQVQLPVRHPLAWVLALFVPYGGRAGGGAAGVIVVAAIIGVLAAVALPAYQDYTQRVRVSQVWQEGAPARAAVAGFYATRKQIPESLQEVGVSDTLPGGTPLSLDSDTMTLSAQLPSGVLLMEPRESAGAPDGVAWSCAAGDGLKRSVLPAGCRTIDTD